MRTLVSNLSGMSPLSRWLLKGGLLVSNGLLLGAILLLWFAGPSTGVTYAYHELARHMRETCTAVLFITAFGSALFEERATR